jgi:hypothetical protein
MGIKVLNTSGASVAVQEDDDLILFHDTAYFGAGPDLFTGVKREVINSGFQIGPKVTIKSYKALPITILNISLEVNVTES